MHILFKFYLDAQVYFNQHFNKASAEWHLNGLHTCFMDVLNE